MRLATLFRDGSQRRPPPRTRHALALRSNWVGGATRWAIRQGLVSLGLHTVGLLAFVVAGFLVAAVAGFIVLGVVCLIMENLLREDHP